MAGMDLEAAIRIVVVAEVVDEAEAITVTTEVGEGVALAEVEGVITEEGEVGKEGPTNRLTMWALVEDATMHREASQITTIMYRGETIIMRRFLPWAAEAYLMASKSVRRLFAKISVRARLTLRTSIGREEQHHNSFSRPQLACYNWTDPASYSCLSHCLLKIYTQSYIFRLLHYV